MLRKLIFFPLLFVFVYFWRGDNNQRLRPFDRTGTSCQIHCGGYGARSKITEQLLNIIENIIQRKSLLSFVFCL